jgi:hypothetical protein
LVEVRTAVSPYVDGNGKLGRWTREEYTLDRITELLSDLLRGIQCAVVGEEDTVQIMRGSKLKDKHDGVCGTRFVTTTG